MKKSSIVLFGVAVALLVVTFFATRKSADTAPAGLTIAGYASQADLDKEKQRKLLDGPLDIDHPIDEIVIERPVPEGTVHLVREGEGKDATWNLTEPVDASAVKYLVDKITGLFKTETQSVAAKRINEGDLTFFDLEPERRIGLTLKSKGAIYNGVDVWIGRVEKPDDAAGQGGRGGDEDADTWVMAKGDATIAYRLGGKDLRTPAEEKLDNLRDKKAFTVKPEDLVEVTATGPDGRRFTLTGTKKAEAPPEPPPDGGEAPKPKPPTVEWALTEPAGLTADASAGALARSLAGLRAKTFVPQAEAPATALSGAVWKLAAKTADGEVLELVVQDGGKDDVWAQVVGRDELMQLAGYAADGVRKTVEDVQDKKILDVTPDQVTGVVFQGPDGPVAVDKQEGTWRFTEPALPYPAELTTLMPSLTKISCARWARPDEAAAARAAIAAPGGVTGVLTTATGPLRLTFSSKMDAEPYDGKRWGVVGDVATGAPFLAQDFVATRLEATADKLREKKVSAGRSKADLRSITVQIPGVTAPVVYESPAGGGEPTLTQVPEGKTADEAQVRTVVATASALAAKGFSDKSATDAGLEGEGLTRVTLGWADGATQTVIISAKDDGTDPFARVDSGPLAGGVFTLNSYQVKNLQKQPSELVK